MRPRTKVSEDEVWLDDMVIELVQDVTKSWENTADKLRELSKRVKELPTDILPDDEKRELLHKQIFGCFQLFFMSLFDAKTAMDLTSHLSDSFRIQHEKRARR